MHNACRKKGPPAGREKEAKTTMIVIAVKEPAFLIAMGKIMGAPPSAIFGPRLHVALGL
jgi:hypothetical protein